MTPWDLSVPLSSGRWLQLAIFVQHRLAVVIFQSPCHRGDGCNGLFPPVQGDRFRFQSPCHRGDGCNVGNVLQEIAVRQIFQSPCHRGDGCNLHVLAPTAAGRFPFQSPCHRGDGCNSASHFASWAAASTFSPLVIGAMAATGPVDERRHLAAQLSVPLSSGRWLQLLQYRGRSVATTTFSPLVIGAMAATAQAAGQKMLAGTFSPLVIGAMAATRRISF